MSTAGSASYAECDEFIDYQVETARKRIKWTDLTSAALLTAVLLVGYVLVFTIIDHWLVPGGFGSVTRATLLVIVLTICAGIIYRFIIRPWSRQIHPVYAASTLDKPGGELDGALRSLVDLNLTGAPVPESIRRTLEKRAAVKLAEVNVDEAIDRRWLLTLGAILFGLVLSTCLYAVFSPKDMNLLRPLSISDAAVATTTRILKIQPGSTSVNAGQQVEITVDLAGTIPEEVTVSYSTADLTYVDEVIAMEPTDQDGRFSVLLVGESNRGIRQDVTYRVLAGDAVSPLYTISVTQPPTVSVGQVDYVYPGYMQLAERSSDGGNIDAWEGSQVTFHAEANMPLTSAMLRFSDDPSFSTPAEEVYLDIDGLQVTGSCHLDLREDGTAPRYYRIDVKDEQGNVDPSPTVYTVNVRPDQAPRIKLHDPIRDIRVPSNAIVPLLVSAEDPDFLLRSVKLEFEVNGELRTPEILFDSSRGGLKKQWKGIWDFDLRTLGLQNGDVIRYFVTARDNKPPLGSQSRTATLQLLIENAVPEEEVQKKLREDHRRQEQQQPQDTASPQDQGASNDQSDSGDQSGSPDGGTSEASGSQEAEGTQTGENSGATGSDQGAQSGDSGGESGQPGDPSGDGQIGPNSASPTEDGTANESGSAPPRDQPATDDEALQKILERYRESAGTSPDPQPGDPATDSEPDPGANDEASAPAPSGSAPEAGTGDQSDADNAETSDGSQAGPEADEQSGEASESSSEQTPAASDAKSPDGTGVDEASDSGAGDETNPDGQEDNPSEGDPASPTEREDGRESIGGDGSEADDPTSDTMPPESGTEAAQDPSQDQQGGESGQQGSESGQQGGESGQQGGESGQQGGESGQQGGESGQQGGESGQQGGESGQQGGESGQQGGESGQQGGESGQQGGESGQQGGESGQQGGESGQQGGESGQQGGESGQQGGESGQQGGESGQQGAQSAGSGGERTGGAAQGGNPSGGGGEGAGENKFQADDANVKDAAQAADLVLKRLREEMERGEVDQSLLDELGWTQQDLESFGDRMRKQLDTLKDQPAPADTTQQRQRKRVEELLRSLDLKSRSTGRSGQTDRDTEQQDTSFRRSPPPSQYRDLLKMYQRSLSEGRRQ